MSSYICFLSFFSFYNKTENVKQHKQSKLKVKAIYENEPVGAQPYDQGVFWIAVLGEIRQDMVCFEIMICFMNFFF